MLKYINNMKFNSYEDLIENFHLDIPDNFNFAYDIFDKIADEAPDRLAMVWCDDNGSEKRFTFGELREQCDRTANYLASLGIGKGDPVMLILKGRYEFWFCILALHKLGAICIPATHLLTTKDIVYRNNAADIKMVISVDEDQVIQHVDESEASSPSLQHKLMLGGSREGWLDFYQGINRSASHYKPDLKNMTTNDDILLIYFTSGTTGQPKMVRHNFTYPLGHVVTAKFWQNVTDGGLHYTVADTGWAKAVWGKIYGQWICGSAVFVYDYDKFDPLKMLEIISKHKVTTFCAPPTIYRFLIKEDTSQYDLSSLKYCVVAGEPLNPEVYNQFYKRTGIKLMEAYGQTELTVVLCTFPWMEPKPGSMGKPAPGYDVLLLDEDDNPCDVGQEGQIVVQTSKQMPLGMFDEYYRDKELTEKVWHDDKYYTGDMAWYDEDGYFWFVGRSDDVIKSSGYRIGPFEVESALMEHPAVLECAITAVPDEIRGQIVKATVVLSRGYKPSDEMVLELQNHVKKVTAPYKYPRIIDFVKELPKTISGKIRRVEIRDQQ